MLDPAEASSHLISHGLFVVLTALGQFNSSAASRLSRPTSPRPRPRTLKSLLSLTHTSSTPIPFPPSRCSTPPTPIIDQQPPSTTMALGGVLPGQVNGRPHKFAFHSESECASSSLHSQPSPSSPVHRKSHRRPKQSISLLTRNRTKQLQPALLLGDCSAVRSVLGRPHYPPPKLTPTLVHPPVAPQWSQCRRNKRREWSQQGQRCEWPPVTQ